MDFNAYIYNMCMIFLNITQHCPVMQLIYGIMALKKMNHIQWVHMFTVLYTLSEILVKLYCNIHNKHMYNHLIQITVRVYEKMTKFSQFRLEVATAAAQYSEMI